MTKLLDKINSPKDIKNLSINELNSLAQEIRDGIINRVNIVGGHLGPDLGIVEMTLAMHYVFSSPTDKIVFDVSHQCYPHKMITGRSRAFFNPLGNKDISGYSNPAESEHDHFVIGHTSTSISLATGLAKARDLKNEKYNIIALIGDGSLSGGEAFEGLNNAATLNSNMIIIVNDNEMSIAENQGGLYNNLELLRNTQGKAENNFFKTFGYEYMYLEEGNDIGKLIEIFNKVKDYEKPIVLHIRTLKGKGFQPAMDNKEWGHWTMPGILDEQKSRTPQGECYESITTDFILNKKAQKVPVVAISPATPGATGFYKEFREKLGENYTDVAIAEQHAIGYASGLAANGARPVVAVLSSFIQRAYDQLSQHLALNNNPATILVYWGGISPADMTHLGSFDIPLICNIPNLVYLAPTCKEEYLAMLEWSTTQNEHSVVIRVPFGEFISTGVEDKTDYSILNKYKVLNKGEKVAIIAAGNFFQLGEQVKELLATKGINATLINPIYLTGQDEELLNSLKENHKVVITLESGVLDGGFGEKIARFYGDSDMKVLNFGGKKEFTDRVDMQELLNRYHLTPDLIVKDIEELL